MGAHLLRKFRKLSDSLHVAKDVSRISRAQDRTTVVLVSSSSG
jgi:hypothetical protein